MSNYAEIIHSILEEQTNKVMFKSLLVTESNKKALPIKFGSIK